VGINFVEKLWGATWGSRNNFDEQLCAAASNRSFEKPQLWGTAFWSSFGKQEQLCSAASNTSFEKPQLWGL
jgi:hypothetical protein